VTLNKPGFRAWLIFLSALAIIGVLLFRAGSQKVMQSLPPVSASERMVLNRTYENYKDSVLKVANKFDISASYLLALIALECSGRTDIPARFEPHVYRRLQELQSGSRKQMERVKTETISDASPEALKNMASSWGPFQIMGYKCVELDGTNVIDLRSERAIHFGGVWINKNYGELLREQRFKDAFHFHNTGKLYPRIGPPRTFHPEYVANGLKYQKYFEALMESE
jgi:hypothetical protein